MSGLSRLNPMRLVDSLDGGRWMALVAVGAAAVVAWGLPPRTIDWRQMSVEEQPTQSELRLRAMRRAAVLENATRIRGRWLDAVLQEAETTAQGELVTWLPNDASESDVAAFRRPFTEALASLSPEGPQARIGIFRVEANQGGHPAFDKLDRMIGREIYVGHSDSGVPHCLVGQVQRGPPGSLDAPEGYKAAIRTLGPCAFYAVFGMPGAQVQEWLEEGGHRYAGIVFTDRFPAVGVQSARGRFGRMERNGDEILLKQACVAGDAASCERLFLEPLVNASFYTLSPYVRERPPQVTFDRRGSVWFNVDLLGWMKNEFGDEAFHSFWTSEKPVKEAFEEAFPISLEDYMRDWSVKMIGPVQAGPAPRTANLFGGLVFLLISVIVSVFFARRETARLF